MRCLSKSNGVQCTLPRGHYEMHMSTLGDGLVAYWGTYPALQAGASTPDGSRQAGVDPDDSPRVGAGPQ